MISGVFWSDLRCRSRHAGGRQRHAEVCEALAADCERLGIVGVTPNEIRARIPVADEARRVAAECRDAEKHAAALESLSSERSGDRIRLTFDYDAEMVCTIRAIDGRSWDGSAWLVPVAAAFELLEAFTAIANVEPMTGVVDAAADVFTRP